jgi:hypothetical protein
MQKHIETLTEAHKSAMTPKRRVLVRGSDGRVSHMDEIPLQ